MQNTYSDQKLGKFVKFETKTWLTYQHSKEIETEENFALFFKCKDKWQTTSIT